MKEMMWHIRLIRKRIFYIPRRWNDVKWEYVEKEDPNIDNPFVQFHNPKNNTTGSEVLIWNTHSTANEQNKQIKKLKGFDNQNNDYRDAHKEIFFMMGEGIRLIM